MVGWPVTTPSAERFLQLLHRILLVQIAEWRRDVSGLGLSLSIAWQFTQ